MQNKSTNAAKLTINWKMFIMQTYLSLWILFKADIHYCQDRSHWYETAKAAFLKNEASVESQHSIAKNVILFIGDGMGMSTITAARILKGQQFGISGEEHQLSFDKFPNIALSKTYNIDSQVGDSGACATALFCGVKSRYETIGVDQNGKYEDCQSTFTSRVTSIADWFQHEGKSTGLVTTTRITHATPAALYSHSASRYWESDDKLPYTAKGLCKDIARQLIEDEPGKNLNVILGGGRRHLTGVLNRDPHTPNEFGRRIDNRNLIEDWLLDKKYRGLNARYVKDKSQFDALNVSRIDYLLGIFNSNHLSHELDRLEAPSTEPSLSQMTAKAIEVLRHNPNGYLLVVESGRIDHAHHLNNAKRALFDTLALDDAIITAMKMTQTSNTLLVVTADHSHVFTFGGFPKRGNPILAVDSRVSDIDSLPYTTLLYANGPGYTKYRENISKLDTKDKDYVQQSAVPRRWETHGGEDVPVYAYGAKSHLFSGVIDQTYIPFAISYASCVGPFSQLCKHRNQNTRNQHNALCINFTHALTQQSFSSAVKLFVPNYANYTVFAILMLITVKEITVNVIHITNS